MTWISILLIKICRNRKINKINFSRNYWQFILFYSELTIFSIFFMLCYNFYQNEYWLKGSSILFYFLVFSKKKCEWLNFKNLIFSVDSKKIQNQFFWVTSILDNAISKLQRVVRYQWIKYNTSHKVFVKITLNWFLCEELSLSYIYVWNICKKVIGFISFISSVKLRVLKEVNSWLEKRTLILLLVITAITIDNLKLILENIAIKINWIK
jgi:hypothetical protein